MTAAYDSLISEDLLNDLAAHTEALNDAAIERLDIDDFKGMALALEAEEACAWGLVDRIVEPGALMDSARALLSDALAAKPEIARGILEMCR